MKHQLAEQKNLVFPHSDLSPASDERASKLTSAKAEVKLKTKKTGRRQCSFVTTGLTFFPPQIEGKKDNVETISSGEQIG